MILIIAIAILALNTAGIVICAVLLRAMKASPTTNLESRMRSLETEWTNVYDKINRLAARLAKERGLMEKLEEPAALPAIDARISSLDQARVSRSELLARR